jgi:hypothetical protein
MHNVCLRLGTCLNLLSCLYEIRIWLVTLFIGRLQLVITTVSPSQFYTFSSSLQHALSLLGQLSLRQVSVPASNGGRSPSSGFPNCLHVSVTVTMDLQWTLKLHRASSTTVPLISNLHWNPSKLKLYIKYYWRSVGQSWCRAPIRSPWLDFSFLFDNCGLLAVSHPLWQEDGSVIYWYNSFWAMSLWGPSPAELRPYFTVSFETPPKPCGGGLEYLHHSPASRKRRQKGNPVPGGYD